MLVFYFFWKEVIHVDIKKRLRNPVTVVSFLTMFLTVIYNILAMCEITPKVSQSEVMETANIIVCMLSLLGILIDPTTDGITDKKDT